VSHNARNPDAVPSVRESPSAFPKDPRMRIVCWRARRPAGIEVPRGQGPGPSVVQSWRHDKTNDGRRECSVRPRLCVWLADQQRPPRRRRGGRLAGERWRGIDDRDWQRRRDRVRDGRDDGYRDGRRDGRGHRRGRHGRDRYRRRRRRSGRQLGRGRWRRRWNRDEAGRRDAAHRQRCRQECRCRRRRRRRDFRLRERRGHLRRDGQRLRRLSRRVLSPQHAVGMPGQRVVLHPECPVKQSLHPIRRHL